MNGNDALDPQACKEDIVELGSTTPRVVLHRLAAVRRAKGIPRRVLAQRLGITVQELRVKEESADLSISTLCHWASAAGCAHYGARRRTGRVLGPDPSWPSRRRPG